MVAATLVPDGLSAGQLLLIGLAGIAGGGANALAGGGTFFTFPVLTGVGLPATVANVTNTVAMSPGYLGGTLAQHRDLRGQGPRLRPFISVGILGGVLGGLLLVSTREAVFDVLVPFLILGATILLAIQDRMRAWIDRRPAATNEGSREVRPWSIFLVFLASIYGGYFGAGLGIVLLAVIGLGIDDTLARINGLKQAVSFWVNVSAAAFFLFSGQVAWSAAGVLAIGALVGGAIGGRFAGRASEQLLRRIIVSIGLLVSLAFFVRLL